MCIISKEKNPNIDHRLLAVVSSSVRNGIWGGMAFGEQQRGPIFLTLHILYCLNALQRVHIVCRNKKKFFKIYLKISYTSIHFTFKTDFYFTWLAAPCVLLEAPDGGKATSSPECCKHINKDDTSEM